jgi:hypothetical protein
LKQIELLEKTSEKDMWRSELERFTKRYKEWLEIVDKEKNITKTSKDKVPKKR